MAEGALVLDLVGEVGADLVAVPVHAPHRLVEVGVAFDEAGQQQGALAVFDGGAGRCGQRRADLGNAAVVHAHIDRRRTQGAHVADQ
ncbi:hypothetical protein D9M69_708570 [compost metagenome]